ncbi:MAG: peptidylprolyl isomerase [Phycisphaerae bacterium]
MAEGFVPNGKLMAFALSALLIWPSTGCSEQAGGVEKPAATTAPASQPASERVLIRIGDKAVVTQADVEEILRETPPERRRSSAYKALGLALTNKLFLIYLDEHPDLVTQEDIDREIDKDVKISKVKTIEEMKMNLASSGVSWDEYLRQLRIRLGQGKLSKMGAAKAKDDEYLRQIYEEHPDYYNDTRVQLRHIVFASPLTATPEEKKATREALARLREEIVSGKKTWDEAVKLSNDNTRTKGGLLGTLPRYMRLNEVLMKAAWSLEPGQISEVVESGVGYHIIQVLERVPGRRPFDDPHTKFQIRAVMQAQPMVEAMEEIRQKYPIIGVQPMDLASILALPAPATKPAASQPARPSSRSAAAGRTASRPATRASTARPATRPGAVGVGTPGAVARPATRSAPLRPAVPRTTAPGGLPDGMPGARPVSQPSRQ